MALVWWLIVIGAFFALAYKRSSLSVWTLSFLVLLGFYCYFSPAHVIFKTIAAIFFIGIAVILNVKPIRRQLLSKRLLKLYRRAMPKISETEQQAIKAGTVSWGRELFSGYPDWRVLLKYPKPQLTKEEQAFLDGPVNELCSMINDWEITHKNCDLPPEVWQFIKEQGFFSFIIPKQYGGKDFSAFANSEILARIYGSSITVGSTVAVPNSLGPAELLMKYGTDEQKDHLLPRLAKGEEIPCFALTGPIAGSDATAIPDVGIVCKGQHEGKEIIGIRLNWNKRYITLAPIATIIGLAFRLFDPDHLLGDKEDIGITCALIPRNTPGITIGRRHFPLNIPFQNGPIQGKDVFVPVDWIIGGTKMAGHGWRMLVECLSVGRAITLPASAIGGAKVVAFSSGAYARIREQFNTPIGHFEGVEEALTRIAGNTYLIDSARRLTTTLIDLGEKPAVPSAIVKYHAIESARKVANDAMDIHGGKGICLGPKNYLGRNYQGFPIGVTVEGANILTRCLIIFGQGAIRCHPYILKSLEAAIDGDQIDSLKQFDEAIFAHMGMVVSNIVRSLLLGLTCSKLAGSPPGRTKKYFQKLSRFSAAFAITADISMGILGGQLKRREILSGRLSDIFSMLYIGSAVLKHFIDQGEHDEDYPLVELTLHDIINTIKKQFNSYLANFPNRFVGILLRVITFPLGVHLEEPKDALSKKITRRLISKSPMRERLTAGAYVAPTEHNFVGKVGKCFERVLALKDQEKIIKHAAKEGKISGLTFAAKVTDALAKKIITQSQADELLEMDKLRLEVIAVDDFAPDELTNKTA